MNELNNEFFSRIENLLENARKNIKTAVNLSMVYSYFEIGKMIIEEEQNGNDRA